MAAALGVFGCGLAAWAQELGAPDPVPLPADAGGKPAATKATVPAPAVAPADEDARVKELELLVETLEKQNKQLQQELALLPLKPAAPVTPEGKPANPAWEEALAAANKEAEKFRVLYRELLLRVEPLGLDSVRSDKALQERLIEAVRDRQTFKDRNDKAYEQLLTLSEAIMDYLKKPEAEARLRVEAEMRAADELIGTGAVKKHEVQLVSLNDGKIISYKDDYKLAVLDIGLRSGARIGMPLNIYRKDRLIGTAIVVDVRENLSGAVIKQLFNEGDKVRPQDSVRPRTTDGLDL